MVLAASGLAGPLPHAAPQHAQQMHVLVLCGQAPLPCFLVARCPRTWQAAAPLHVTPARVCVRVPLHGPPQRARKVAEQAFLRMLANKTPPMTPASTYAEVEAGCGGDARFLVCGLAAHARPPTTKHGTVTQARTNGTAVAVSHQLLSGCAALGGAGRCLDAARGGS